MARLWCETASSFWARSGSFLRTSPPVFTCSVVGGAACHQGATTSPKLPVSEFLDLSSLSPSSEPVPDGQWALDSAQRMKALW